MNAVLFITPDLPAVSVPAYVQMARTSFDAVTAICGEGTHLPAVDGVHRVGVSVAHPLSAFAAIMGRIPDAEVGVMSQAAYNRAHTLLPTSWAQVPRVTAIQSVQHGSLHVLQQVPGGVRQVTAQTPALLALTPNALPSVPLNPFAPSIPPDETWPLSAQFDLPLPRQRMFTQLDLSAVDELREAAHAATTPPAHGITAGEVTPHDPTLHTAPIIVSGGKGLGFNHPAQPPPGTGNAFAWRVQNGFATLIEPLATALGGTVAASRAVIDAAGVDSALQVGQSGQAVAPDVYIAVGISGAAQHMQGVAHSKLLIAINADAEAPIFAHADYGIVGNAHGVVPRLIAAFGD